ncbi:hypothetical protein CGRA01v4_08948 [Colletotrichum graminicola]|uniref:Uncharacterized protein n=1 Tax=Colletotrichum graminicola (strain M1.001 / M2 / FGSC 10212) TaxID=645133 RepID=E3Q7E5_COLGM|nr:uncharacterized protein GLRG_02603 [Colletotrichum graminicola M1.001]EFQ26783.1 hypothetical protein GLRG_02603 [Colletotrichum graminicola M1.001]WDK17665.1 hypothetical protein CGRA01v4_08948 [Colletotrichum graminicola]
MNGNHFPTFENRTAWLADAMRILDQVFLHSDLGRDFIKRVAVLRDRVQSCAARHDSEVDKEIAIHRDAIYLQHDVHRATNYHNFIHRLEEADTLNLVACYLPESSWVQDMLRKPGFIVDCYLCREWATGHDQARDCGFPTMLPVVFLRHFTDERRDFCQWLQKLVAGLAMLPQPPTPMDGYIARVAEYSRAHSHGENVWTYERIFETMKEAKFRAEGRQINYRQFLWTGWGDTLGRIRHDWATAATRVRGFLAPDRSEELVKAIRNDAGTYYVRSLRLTGDQQCVDQQPRQWVLEWLRHYRSASKPRFKRWRRILTIDRVWPLFYVVKSLDMFVKIRFRETGRGCWEYRWIGRLDTPGSELWTLVRSNVWDEQARRTAAEWSEEPERGSGHEGGESEASRGRVNEGQDNDS